MLELTAERVGSYERENIIYFNAGRDDQLFIVSVHDHKIILEVMKGSSHLIKKELCGFSEDTHFYLIDSYNDTIVIVYLENHTCQLATYCINSNKINPICSFLLSANVFHLGEDGLLWIGLTDEGMYDERNPQGKAIFAFHAEDRTFYFEDDFKEMMHECYAVQSIKSDLYVCFEGEDCCVIGHYQIEQDRIRTVAEYVLNGDQYSYCDQLSVSKNRVLLIQNHEDNVFAFHEESKGLSEADVMIHGIDRKEETAYRAVQNRIFIFNGNDLYLVKC
ncbi:hypothetical protein QRX25_18945 [Bacillus sp. L381]|uniref:hypothetical protein n=1 Tax=Bacillus TaxID=1386 RepID=UPI001BA8291C|nr:MULTISPECIES: hypothetical protein [Bacillus]MCR9040017.1 hypothetical protein [Bacillus velezensis]QUN09516.1 hypothetical protein KEF49_18735 [Bacillus amyloliquefaciens]QYM82590.1 hypothetical protein KTJ85_18585 [Bacillus sp. 7D3]QZY11823.1 hypothetical protein K7B13_19305 [Bacillus amyloliquefaciens]WIX21642.1 hypothetical protein QRX25_18945 [Bacillus sp. L381]